MICGVYSAGRSAAKFAAGIQRTIEEGRSEVRPQRSTRDPQGCSGFPIHGKQPQLAAKIAFVKEASAPNPFVLDGADVLFADHW